MMAICSVSCGVMARMLPMIMVWTLIEVGLTEIMNRPRPKKEVKMMPMMTSIFRPERSLRKSMEPAASPPAMKAPSEKGRPSMKAPATPGTTEWLSASPISDQPFSIR